MFASLGGLVIRYRGLMVVIYTASETPSPVPRADSKSRLGSEDAGVKARRICLNAYAYAYASARTT